MASSEMVSSLRPLNFPAELASVNLSRAFSPLGSTTWSLTTTGASSEARNVWPVEAVAESTESMVRTVTIVPSGIVTVIGCGGGGGGRGAGAAAGCGFAGGGGGADAVSSDAGVAGIGAGLTSGAFFFFGSTFLGSGAGSGGGGGAGSAAAAGAGGGIVVESITCLTPIVFEAMVSAASRAASSGTSPVSVTIPSLLLTFTFADFSEGSEYIFALICVVIVSSFALLHATAKIPESNSTLST